jgi:hypothetical protein
MMKRHLDQASVGALTMLLHGEGVRAVLRTSRCVQNLKGDPGQIAAWVSSREVIECMFTDDRGGADIAEYGSAML